MTNAKLDAIEARNNALRSHIVMDKAAMVRAIQLARDDIPALVAEVRRLRKLLDARTVVHAVKKVVTQLR